MIDYTALFRRSDELFRRGFYYYYAQQQQIINNTIIMMVRGSPDR